MKLFQRLLVAPAALGLLSPLAVNANEINLNAISDYTDDQIEFDSNSFKSIPSEKSFLISGGEGLVDDSSSISSDSFSETTTASFSADFAIGSVAGGTETTNDAVNAGYGFQIDLNTSFTGEDSFDVSLDAGSPNAAGYTEFDLNDNNTDLTVDGIAYTFPLAGATVSVGDGNDGSVLFTTACQYGTPSDTFDACGTPSSAFAGLGNTFAAASYDFGNGWSVAAGYEGEGDNADGLMTQEGADAFGANVAYIADGYGLSINTALIEDTSGVDSTYNGINAYWTPEGFPTFSAGYEYGDVGSAAATVDGRTSYFIGVQFPEVGPGSLGAAVGTKQATVEGSDDLTMYEVFYDYPVNDQMMITPLAYTKEFAAGTEDETGLMVKTSFSF